MSHLPRVPCVDWQTLEILERREDFQLRSVDHTSEAIKYIQKKNEEEVGYSRRRFTTNLSIKDLESSVCRPRIALHAFSGSERLDHGVEVRKFLCLRKRAHFAHEVHLRHELVDFHLKAPNIGEKENVKPRHCW
jgi:hypothetical protein